MSDFRNACRELDEQVDRLAAEYVRGGMAPWEAWQKASDEIAKKRQLRFSEHLERASSIVSGWPAWKRNVLGCLLVLFCVSFASADEPTKPIRLPVIDNAEPAPVVPPQPKPVTVLPEDHFFVVESDVQLIVLHSPDGILDISEDQGPIRLRGKFAGGSGKIESKTFSGKYVYTIEGKQTKQTELVLIPIGVTSSEQIVRAVLSVNGAKPPPPKPDDEDKDRPPAPVKSFRVIFVKESGQTLPVAQAAIPSAEVIRKYVADKCTKEDGQPGFREYDPQQVTTDEQPVMKALWAAVQPKLLPAPCLVVEVNGHATVMPFPASVDECMSTLKKYGGE